MGALKWALKVVVHNFYKRAQKPQMRTIANDCARVRERERPQAPIWEPPFGFSPKLDTAQQIPESKLEYPPPPPKILPAAFFVCELISSGLPEKSVTWLPEIMSGELNPWDYRKVWPGLSVVWGDVKWWQTRITGNIGNAITRNNSGRIILGQLPEKLVIGSLWLPEKMFDELILAIFSAGGGGEPLSTKTLHT